MLTRYARTVAHLRPTQVVHRIKLRTMRAALGARPGPLALRWRVAPGGDLGMPPGFRALDATLLADAWDPEEIGRGSFEFLNERRELGPHVRWDPDGASHLWLFHHHYWEWAWSLAAAPDREASRATFARQWTSWRTQVGFGQWDGWAPYTTSLRAWVLVNVFDDLIAGSTLEQTMVEDLGLHAGFLTRNLERDLGGNHLIKNIKALYGLGTFLGVDSLVDSAQRLLVQELAVQVLADGGHFELSPSYQCQVLGDLVDIAALIKAAGTPPLPELDSAVSRMRTWLGLMVMPDGDIPLFNDCEPVSLERIAQLAPDSAPDIPLTVLPDSGFAIVRRGPFHLVADVGQPGPDELPAHAHADCLSFELAVDGRRVVVDAGTSEYGSGPRRVFERSTAAHNTIEVDGTDQTEVWGAFRAGRRARATLDRADATDASVEVAASHDGYRHLDGAPIHHRSWTVTDHEVTIRDTVTGSGRHRLASRLTFPAAVARGAGAPEGNDGGGNSSIPSAKTYGIPSAMPSRSKTSATPEPIITVNGPHLEGATTAPARSWRRSEVAQGFGELVPANVLELVVEGDLPLTLTCSLDVPRRGAGPRP